jgi:hypothetical protein
MTTHIPLTRGFVALVDDSDLPTLLPFKWHTTSGGYAATRMPGTRQYVYLHRLLLQAGPDDLVDHIDGNTLNNTRANLRIVDDCQNQWNRKAQANASGHKGVAWNPRKRKYYARIQANNHRHFLGYFATAEAAAQAYADAAHELFGEYAHRELATC